MNPDYAAVLARRHQGREWSLNANDYDQLTMLDDDPKPSKKSLDDAWPDVQAEIAAEQVDRAAARQAVLDKLGLTDDEAKALFG